MKITIHFAFLFLCLIACKGPKLASDVFSDVIPEDSNPQYYRLNFPTEKIDIPGIIIGTQSTISGGCFKLNKDEILKENKSLSSLVTQAKQERTFEAGLKATLKKELIDAGLEASISDLLSNNVKTNIKNASVYTISPDKVMPDFTNGSCLINDLGYFTDKRIVVIGGIMADTFEVETSGNLSQDQQAKFDIAISKLNSSLSTSFKRAVSENASINLKATNVYFGAITANLRAVNCSRNDTLNLKKGKREIIDLCKGFHLSIERSSNFPKKYMIQITKQQGESLSIGPYDIIENKLYSYFLGINRQLSIQIIELSKKRQALSVDITLIGVSGASNFK